MSLYSAKLLTNASILLQDVERFVTKQLKLLFGQNKLVKKSLLSEKYFLLLLCWVMFHFKDFFQTFVPIQILFLLQMNTRMKMLLSTEYRKFNGYIHPS